MVRHKKKRWKQFGSVMMAAAVFVTSVPTSVLASTSTVVDENTFKNPVIYSDVPDVDVIRVDDNYYMVSTTMHLSPGCPIMKSKDLVNWEIVNYCYGIMDDGDKLSLRNGESAYGNGSWAASLKYHNGRYYVGMSSLDTGITYFFTTTDIENGTWTRSELPGYSHDMGLFFDDDDKLYMFTSGGGKVFVKEMTEDGQGHIGYSDKEAVTIINDASIDCEGLAPEGCHVYKKDGKYYAMLIQWPSDARRQEICWRADDIYGTWEGKKVLDSGLEFDGIMDNSGIAQGGLIEAEDGSWYSMLFQDHGAVGRIPVLVKVNWEDGWPMMENASETMELPVKGQEKTSIVVSDEFYNGDTMRLYDDKTASYSSASASEAKVYSLNEIFDDENTGKMQEETVGEEVTGTPELIEEVSVEEVNDSQEVMEISLDEEQVGDTQEQKKELIVNGTFDGGTDSWEGNENASIAVESINENSALKISDRSVGASGPRQMLTGKIVKGGIYEFSADVYYDAENAPENKQFNICIQNGDWTGIKIVGSVTVKKGQWCTVTGSFTVPEDANLSQSFVFVETPWKPEPDKDEDLFDFYVDNISVKETFVPDISNTPPETTDEDELLLNGTFEEEDTSVWTTHNSATLTVTNDKAATGTRSVYVTNRDTTGAGPMQDITGKVTQSGEYEFSAKIFYDDANAPASKRFQICIVNNGDIKVAAGGEIQKGEWGTISGSYTIPSDADLSSSQIFVETVWTAEQDEITDRFPFYADDISVVEKSSPELIKNGGFEKNNLNSWGVHDPSTLTIVSDDKASGSNSLKVTDRTTTGSGPKQDLTGKLKSGETYKVSAKLKYTDANAVDSRDFALSLHNGSSEKPYINMVIGTVQKGDWVILEGTYTIPDDIDVDSYAALYLETTWTPEPTSEKDLFDFYVDDISMQKVVKTDSEELGENEYNGSNLKLEWQWNHNPNNNDWSLTERPGYLRLGTVSKAKDIQSARNTLTQRTYGPTCSGNVALEVGNMKDGDVAGLAAFQLKYGFAGVKMENGKRYVVMRSADSKGENETEQACVELEQERVYLKVDFDYTQRADDAYFYYSLDGNTWNQIGDKLDLEYTLPHFMGYRFGLFNYATKSTGGYVDFDYFHVEDQITNSSSGETSEVTTVKAQMEDMQVLGVANTQVEIPVTLESIPEGAYSKITASISIPKLLDVTDVEFNKNNLSGETSYSYKNGQLTLNVTGDKTGYAASEKDQIFAVIKAKVNQYVSKETTAAVRMDYMKVTGGNVKVNVSGAVSKVTLTKLESDALAKLLGNSNPLVDFKYGADPYALEYNGRVYIYMTSDEYEYDENGNVTDNTYGKINTISVISSADMVNWTDHGKIKVAGKEGAASWANCSWAPAAAHKKIDGKDKFFLYFADAAGGIGVLEADSPIGPFKDPIGEALVKPGSKEAEGVVWLFDPAVLVDDDGTGYLYYGGGVPEGEELNPKTARVIKLSDDMVHTEGDAQMIDSPKMFEDSGIHKYNGKYYYSYCSNFSGKQKEGYPNDGIICYMVSDNPMGPFSYQGEILQNMAEFFQVGGNNHHAIFNFDGETYITYHAQTLGKAVGIEKGYRSTHINKVNYYSNGNIKPIKADYKGISQLENLNPYQRVEAESIAWQAGIETAKCSEKGSVVDSVNMQVKSIQKGDWISAAGVDFGEKGAASFVISAASENSGNIQLRLDSPEGTLIGTVDVADTDGKWKEFRCDVTGAVGVHNVFLVFGGDADKDLMSLDYWKFQEKTDDQKPTETPKPSEPTETPKPETPKPSEPTETPKPETPKPSEPTETPKPQKKPEIGGKDFTIKVSSTQKYTGKSVKPTPTITYKGKKLAAGKDYTVTYKNNKNIGTGQVIITGIGNFTGKITKNFKITVTTGSVYTVGSFIYKITNADTSGKGTVTIIDLTRNNAIHIEERSTVKIGGKTFKVTAIGDNAFRNSTKAKDAVIGKYVTKIGKNAFYNCKNLKKITVKSTQIKSVGSNAFKGIYKTAVIKVPASKLTTYKKMFAFKGQSRTVKIQK